MKKLFFAVIAAVAMVSVSNVFAGNKMVNMTSAEPVDTVAPADTTQNETEKTAPTDTTLSEETTPTVDSTTVNPTATAE